MPALQCEAARFVSCLSNPTHRPLSVPGTPTPEIGCPSFSVSLRALRSKFCRRAWSVARGNGLENLLDIH